MKKFVLLAIVVYLVIINVLGLILMHVDKKKSKKRRRRIPEVTLLGTAVAGGSIGIMAGMEFFRHKTKHKRFYVGVPAILVIQVLITAAIYLFIIR